MNEYTRLFCDFITGKIYLLVQLHQEALHISISPNIPKLLVEEYVRG